VGGKECGHGVRGGVWRKMGWERSLKGGLWRREGVWVRSNAVFMENEDFFGSEWCNDQ
jgi:hypothetical protein